MTGVGNLENESDFSIFYGDEVLTVLPDNIRPVSLGLDCNGEVLFIGSIEGTFEYREGILYDPTGRKVYRN